MSFSFEEGLVAALLFLLGLLLGALLMSGNKWRRRHDELHERHVSLEAERDGWRARHQALEGERETWTRERAEWERRHATAPAQPTVTEVHAAPASTGPAMATGLGTAALHGHPDNVAPIRRETTVERTEVRRLDPSEVREVELGDGRRAADEDAAAARPVPPASGEGFAPSYPQRSEVRRD